MMAKFMVPIRKFDFTPEMMEEHLTYFWLHKSEFIAKAMTERDRGISHRTPPFRVGCSAMAVGPHHQHGTYAMYWDHNETPVPAQRIAENKRCAERKTVERVLINECDVIIVLITVSREKSTGDEDEHDVLHPCRECRDMFRELLSYGILRPNSLLVNVNDADANSIVEKEMTVEELLKSYEDDLKEN